jgi:LPXTG-motif cell wall-anchored protein
MLVSLFALAVGLYFKYTKNMKHKKPTRTIHRYAGWAGAVLFVLTTISGFLQALVNAGEEAPIWFIIVMVLILGALIGAAIFVILKGKKK